MTVYELTLVVHSWVRWLLVVAAIVLIVRSAFAWRRGHEWTATHERAHAALVGLADLQFTLGVCLYVFWSPFAAAFISNPAVAIKEHTLRFFGLEHPTMMVLAVALLHIGRARAKRATSARDQHRVALRWTLAALLVVLTSIPWPGLRHGRPLFRVTPSSTLTPP